MYIQINITRVESHEKIDGIILCHLEDKNPLITFMELCVDCSWCTSRWDHTEFHLSLISYDLMLFDKHSSPITR